MPSRKNGVRHFSLFCSPYARLLSLFSLHFWIFAEKLEDRKARAAIKAQIEADKRERAEKAAREKALREGKAIPTSSSPVPTIVPKADTGTKSSDNPETRLQIRLATGGAPMTKTFPSDNSM